MYRLVESICVENKRLLHTALHQTRLAKTMLELFDTRLNESLESFIQLPEQLDSARHKCRLTWNPDEGFLYTIVPYRQRKITSVKLLTLNEIEYAYKTDRRQQLDAAFSMRGPCDDVLIVKNNCLTDAWASNIILFDGCHWLTPDTPLLNGIQRAHLLNEGIIREARITTDSLYKFQKIKLINAMVDFDRAEEISIERVFR